LPENFYVSPQVISERTALLLEHARDLLKSDAIPRDRVDLAEYRIPLISEGYFLLNQAYKDWRMPGGHFTELPKIAALQSLVIARLQPFFPRKYPVDDTDIGVIKCNEIFAVSYGMGILERSFAPNTPEKIDFWLRLLDIVTSSSCETIEPYIVDKKLEITKPLAQYASINKVLECDRPALNSLICIFELLSEKGDRVRSTGASAT
jgi:hypothetical protein